MPDKHKLQEGHGWTLIIGIPTMAPVLAAPAAPGASTKELLVENAYNSEEDEDFEDDGEQDDEDELSADEGARLC